jgi:hypothetical protein
VARSWRGCFRLIRPDQSNPGGLRRTGPRVRRMSHFAVSGRVDELTDGTVGSVDAVTDAKSGPYRKSRLTRHCW